LGSLDLIELGNLDAQRDWGYAKDYVDGMWRILQADSADTYVLSTNRTESVRRFATMSFKVVGIDIEWRGQGIEEVGICSESGRKLIVINSDFYRPAEVELLVGDSSKALAELGWQATTKLEDLCEMMVNSDIDRNTKGYSF
jgi:GDPmannose 4,6-dehydratase